MKKLFTLLISIILVASPLLSKQKETGVLFLWDTSNGQVWKTFGDKNTHPKYEGEIKKGKPDGLGILYNGWYWYRGKFIFYPDENAKTFGEWKEGKPHGQVTFLHDSYTRKGEFRDGREWNTVSGPKGLIDSKVVNGEHKTWNMIIRGPGKKIIVEIVDGVLQPVSK